MRLYVIYFWNDNHSSFCPVSNVQPKAVAVAGILCGKAGERIQEF